MTEKKSIRIAIASVLKPVDDTRMFEKLGASLEKAGYDVHIIGHSGAQNTRVSENVTLHRIGSFRRLSLPRAFAKWKILIKAFQIRPSLFIICTHELLLPSVLLKLFTGCKIIYDIQENYAYNIRYTKAFPAAIRHFVAAYVRFKELLYGHFVDHFFLAEKNYSDELSFIKNRYSVLQNKVRQSVIRVRHRRNDGRTVLLFTGTLDESTGIFEAIRFATDLHNCDGKIILRIVGHAANAKMYDRILKEIDNRNYIELVGGDRLVSHGDIMTEIANADYGLIAYHLTPVTRRKTPTKIFEYIASHLPIILLSDNELWRTMTTQCTGGISGHGKKAEDVLKDLSNTRFYTENVDGIYWEEEKFKLLTAVKGLLQS